MIVIIISIYLGIAFIVFLYTFLISRVEDIQYIKDDSIWECVAYGLLWGVLVVKSIISVFKLMLK